MKTIRKAINGLLYLLFTVGFTMVAVCAWVLNVVLQRSKPMAERVSSDRTSTESGVEADEVAIDSAGRY